MQRWSSAATIQRGQGADEGGSRRWPARFLAAAIAVTGGHLGCASTLWVMVGPTVGPEPLLLPAAAAIVHIAGRHPPPHCRRCTFNRRDQRCAEGKHLRSTSATSQPSSPSSRQPPRALQPTRAMAKKVAEKAEETEMIEKEEEEEVAGG
ncbi:UNVERIFIED_CONTAM: hypothetical protein K2H54_035057 [Gekko kuhli]